MGNFDHTNNPNISSVEIVYSVTYTPECHAILIRSAGGFSHRSFHLLVATHTTCNFSLVCSSADLFSIALSLSWGYQSTLRPMT